MGVLPPSMYFLCAIILFLILYIKAETDSDLLQNSGSGPKAKPAKRLRTVDKLKTLLPVNYDLDTPPGNKSHGAIVDVSIWITRIHSVSEAQMSFGMDVYLSEEWIDRRLSFDSSKFDNKNTITLTDEVFDTIWHPDTYFPNAQAIDQNDKSISHSTLHLASNGSIWYSRRLDIVGDCPMHLLFYPFDKQACKLRIGSYGATVNKIRYRWRNFVPVKMESSIKLPEFSMQGYEPSERIAQYTSGNYSYVQICVRLERSYGFCLMQFVVPAAAVVFSSWVALWQESETQFNDVIAVILAIIFLAYAYNSVMPRVSYVKLMDIYFGAFACCSIVRVTIKSKLA